MKFLLGTIAYNKHIQNIALSLHEAGALEAVQTGWVDRYRQPWLAGLRRGVARVLPAVDRLMKRRAYDLVPERLVYQDWAWEIPRLAAGRLGCRRIEDWLWERSEHRLDAACARLLERNDFEGFLGVEHGSLRAVEKAREIGKKSVVAFLSPHHTLRERWVGAEYDRLPGLSRSPTRRIRERAAERDERRDREARSADAILTNSTFTTRSLIEAGFPAGKMVSVPLGCEPRVRKEDLPSSLWRPLKFLYAGALAVHKGIHHLFEAWSTLGAKIEAELHCYGPTLVPAELLRRPANVVLHGPVSQNELSRAYADAAVLIHPTLYDGFGMVVSEALSHGLPVVTTRNAGAADLIEDGKNGFLIPPADPEAIAGRIDWCVRNPGALVAMRRHALESARRWTWDDYRVCLREKLGRALGVPFAPQRGELHR